MKETFQSSSNNIKTIKDALYWASSFAGCDLLDSRILLAHAMDISDGRKGLILLPPDTPMKAAQIEKFITYIEQRKSGKPVSKIMGRKEFWSHEFMVNKDVLDPRPDSETLIEAVLKNFKDKNKAYKILDLGTGSGCLIITLLMEYKNAVGLAIDKSKNALEIAKQNASRLLGETQSRISFVEGNWNDPIKNDPKQKFDIIISNPPYIKSDDITKLDIDVKDFDPISALDGGDDGIEPYRYILDNIKGNMNDNGKLFFEIGIDQAPLITTLAQNNGFRLLSIKKDIAGIDRCLVFEKKAI